MVDFGGLGMKLCNFDLLELLVLLENRQKAFDALTPEPMRFILTDSGQYLLINVLPIDIMMNGTEVLEWLELEDCA